MIDIDLRDAIFLLVVFVAALLVAGWLREIGSFAWRNRAAIRERVLYRRAIEPCPMCAGKGSYGASGSQGEIAVPCRKCAGKGENPEARLVPRRFAGRWTRREVNAGGGASVEEEMRRLEKEQL